MAIRWRSLTHPPWRDRLTASAFAGLGTVYFLTSAQDVLWTDGRQAPVAVQLGLLYLGAVAVLVRARVPHLALGIGLLAFGASAATVTSLPLTLVLCDVLYAFVLYGPRRHARVVTAAVGVLAVSAVVAALVVVGDWRLALFVAMGFAAIPIIPVWWAMQVRVNREATQAERERADQVARIAELDRRAAVAAERSRMARDLHDVVAGHLSAIAIQSEAVLAMSSTDADADGTIETTLRSVRENSVNALTEMRAMIGLLKGTEADSRTTPPGLRELEPLVESARAGGVDLRLDGDIGALPKLPAAVDLAAYRIVQEALTNIVKHASGTSAELLVGASGADVEVEVSNELPAVGPDPGGGAGAGIANMKDRAAVVGGTLTAGIVADRWQVRAVLPVRGWE